MAVPSCTKCGNHYFEVVESDLYGANYRVFLVQCSRCGGVVGFSDHHLIERMSRQIQQLASATGVALAAGGEMPNRSGVHGESARPVPL